jgi:LysM repeat protein
LILISFSQCRILGKTLTSELTSSLNPQNLFLASGGNSFIEPPDLFFVQDNSLKSASSPTIVTPKVLGSLIGGSNNSETKEEIIEYIVQEGDNLWGLAEKFNISLNTLLWANDLNKNSIISPGQKLIILPVSGLIHHVGKGDTLSEIAKTYKVDTEEIVSFNNLPEDKIFVGDILVVPGGVMPSRSYSSAPSQVPLASSYFICPIPSPCRITQGLHWYNAIDFSNGKCGEPVYAVAGGIIQRVGYGSVSGNFVRIEHPNGVITSYGHLSRILVSSGQSVVQGEKIGYTGYSGYTIPAGPSGCHLHFEARGARNPFAQ